MSFRPRFRLSLLFVFIALVAGVSVWLRQAVVCDRNIRELLAEEWVKGTTDDEVSHLNTKLLNCFYSQKLLDNLNGIELYFDKVSTGEMLRKYRDKDWCLNVTTLKIQPAKLSVWDKVAPLVPLNKEVLKLSLLHECACLFPHLEHLSISDSRIDVDIESFTCKCKCHLLTINSTEIDSTKLSLLISAFQPLNIELRGNDFHGQLAELERLQFFTAEQLRQIAAQNNFLP